MEVQFAPQQPLVVDTFKSCEGLSRIAFLDGNGVVTHWCAFVDGGVRVVELFSENIVCLENDRSWLPLNCTGPVIYTEALRNYGDHFFANLCEHLHCSDQFSTG